MIQLNDLQIVLSLSDDVLICLNKEDNNKKRSMKLVLSKDEYFIDDIDKFCKFAPFEEVSQKEEVQKFYRNWIYRKMSDKVLIKSLIEFGEVSDVKNLHI